MSVSTRPSRARAQIEDVCPLRPAGVRRPGGAGGQEKDTHGGDLPHAIFFKSTGRVWGASRYLPASHLGSTPHRRAPLPIARRRKSRAQSNGDFSPRPFPCRQSSRYWFRIRVVIFEPSEKRANRVGKIARFFQSLLQKRRVVRPVDLLPRRRHLAVVLLRPVRKPAVIAQVQPAQVGEEPGPSVADEPVLRPLDVPLVDIPVADVCARDAARPWHRGRRRARIRATAGRRGTARW